MGDRQTVDPENKFKYYNLESEITSDQSNRMEHYLMRHGLFDQFIAEDAAEALIIQRFNVGTDRLSPEHPR
jgi:hypothetical protein